MNLKGLASYCQECGACAACRSDAAVHGMNAVLVERIVDEVVRTVRQGRTAPASPPPAFARIPLGVSNRHAHLTRATFQRLFGPEATLDVYRELYQPGEFASNQTVTIVGSKMLAIQNVRILGPFRPYDQVELSLTDSIQIGVKAPIRNSGDLADAAPITLAGSKGSAFLNSCAIVANRHVHMSDRDAQAFGVSNGDFCKVRLGGEKPTVFENVLVRAQADWKLQLHLDTDDANAANVRCRAEAEFLGKQ